jgi:hypothetical protein
MSKKIRKPANKSVAPLQSAPKGAPAPNVVPLDDSTDGLVEEWRRLQGIIAKINEDIKGEQTKIAEADGAIKNLQSQGYHIVGAAQQVTRILAARGVDPSNYNAPEPVEKGALDTPKITEKTGPVAVEEVHLPDPKEDVGDSRLAALSRRFSR